MDRKYVVIKNMRLTNKNQKPPHEYPPLFGKWQEQLARPHLLWSGVCQRLDPGHGDWLTVTLGGCQGPRSLPASDWTSDTVSSLPLVSIIHSGSQTTEIKVLQTRKSEKEFTFSSLINDQARRVGARLIHVCPHQKMKINHERLLVLIVMEYWGLIE